MLCFRLHVEEWRKRMLRLGHIEFSNCFPVHAALLDRGAPPGVEIVGGIPSHLNAQLAEGGIDVAPSSSIEYARHADAYRLFPELVIGSFGPVQSILLETTRPLAQLDDAEVALPTASATSVVLLRALLELRHGVRPRYRWFDQATERDPVATGASAALRIGDVALRARFPADRLVVDLGQAWTEWTDLPFAFALWQTSAGPEANPELAALHEALLASRAWFEANDAELAERWSAHFRIEAPRLLRYWRSLTYSLDAPMREGLVRFYGLAAELAEAPPPPRLRWIATRR